MKKAFLILTFGLLLAVGWTNRAQSQELRTRSLAHDLVSLAQPKQVLAESMDFNVHSHSHSTAAPVKHATATNLKEVGKIDVNKSINLKPEKKDATRPGGKANAPLRAGQELPMASITKAAADQMTYTWTDEGGASHTSAATEVAKDPYQMYELLRFVYTDKRFPGPYYSAYTKNDERERKVYYGAIEGGWNIGGDALSGGQTSTVTIPSTSNKTVADGTSTSSGYTYLPIYGMNYDYNQKNQLIYTAAQLGLEAGTQITSITFYPRNGITFSGGNVKLSLGNTTTSTFGSTSLITANDLTQVAETGSITANSSQTEWTITFDQPFTYTGNNVLVQLETTAGTWGRNSSFYGVQLGTNVYQSIYSYGSNNPARSRFLPKATFGYTIEKVVEYDPTYQIGDINITTSSYNVMFRDITVYDENNNVLTRWSYNDTYYNFSSGSDTYTAYNLPLGWDANGLYLFRYSMTPSGSTNTYYYGYLSSPDPGTLTIPYYLMAGHSSVRLVITAIDTDGTPTITVNNGTPVTVSAQYYSGETYEWTINAQQYPHTEYDPDYYLPNEEGYTALIVAVKNQTSPDFDTYESEYDNSYFSTKQQIIDYFTNNVDSIKLLTDGLRIGEGSDYSIGTLFNCEGTYNKFFFLGKGQAKQKPDIVNDREIFRQHLLGELVPFRYMFEQFSPTSGAEGSETTDFYSKMMEGNVYPVVHDCRSVIELGHQFSMSGNEGTTAYAMTGMNFFIPDYRLKYWEDQVGSYTVDGRITNAYQSVSADGNPKLEPSLTLWTASNYSFWYAQYNQDYAPKVGLYKITLDATAEPVAQDYTPGNRNYAVTLHWVSSLDEMAGHEVPQTYTVYYYDENGERQYLVVEGVTTVNGETGETTLTYYVEQFEHSYTIDYVVIGRPTDSEHSQFVAISNIDGVVIPGWDDFVGLDLDHHESDFVVDDMANWYRNFLVVLNEDMYNGLTVSKITGYNAEDPSSPLTPMNTFNLYRWAIKDGVAQGEEKVAVLTFDAADATRVHYKVSYKDNDHADLTEQEILESPKYTRSTMGIPDEGYVRVKGNGDIVIWPNGYHVNFKTITVKNNGSVVTSWNAATMNTLPSGWIVSPGSKWEEYVTTTTGDKVGYMEGGGYIAIPNMLNNSEYTNLSVEIEAYGDGAAVTRIAVNDDSKLISNAAGTTYTWANLSPNAKKAPKRATETHSVTVNENGTATNEYLPLLGYYYDYRQQWTQMIYTADQLNLSVGDVIKSITFYPTTSTLNLTGGAIHVYMASTTESNFDAAFQPASVDYNTSLVASFTPAGNINCSNGWTITFDTPFTYTGGTLVIDMDTETGSTYTNEGDGFYGAETSSSMSLFLYYETSGTDTGWTGGRFNFQPKATFTYDTEVPDGPDDPGTFDPTDAGLLRLHMLMVDQFKEEIPEDNSHPKAYGYVLKYEPEVGEAEQSGTVKVNIEKTEAKVNSYYTKDEIDGDVNADLTMNALKSQVMMDLPDENPNVLYYEMQGGNEAQGYDYLTKLQYMKNVQKYEEMLQSSPFLGGQYEAGTHFYFDDSQPIVTGTYGQDYMTYAPTVSTWGIDRRYYEDDGKDNTYGGPEWKSSVGKIEMRNTNGLIVEKQVAGNGGVNASTHWTDAENQDCDLYMVYNIAADGYLPSEGVSNVDYVPYMFRVFVESPSGKLRGYKPVAAGVNPDLPGNHLENDPDYTNTTGPISIYEENVEDATVVALEGGKGVEWYKAKDNSDYSNNAVFGALSSLITGTNGSLSFDPEDLKVSVRFYYMVAGWNANRDGEARPGNGAGSPGFAPDPWTAVSEVRYVGEVVSRTYYNVQGMQSDKPFDGINIVVTRYSDGTTSTTKVVR